MGAVTGKIETAQSRMVINVMRARIWQKKKKTGRKEKRSEKPLEKRKCFDHVFLRLFILIFARNHFLRSAPRLDQRENP